MRATKLLCTLGPASEPRLGELIAAGMDVARINCSHGTREDHERLLRAVRAAAAESGRQVGVLADLSGPKVRLGELAGGGATLLGGSRFALRGTADGAGSAEGAATSHPGLAEDLQAGDRVLLADGAVELRVLETSSGDVVTEVVRGGTVRSRAGVNVPSERLGLPAITEKDEQDLEWAIGAEVDMVAQSFVRKAQDVRQCRGLLGDPAPLLIAKIETSAAIADAEAIAAEADAIMVARGDLGVETPLEEIPILQKRLIALAIRNATPAIVATQMLESMIGSSQPTRAEASDVAGAVFDGVDAILLSAETAIGKYPVEAASTAARILEVSQRAGQTYVPRRRQEDYPRLEEGPLAQAAALLARQAGSAAVVCFTVSGLTARLVSAARPGVPIHAFSPEPGALGRMTLFHGVTPFPVDPPDSTDAMIASMDEGVRARGLAAEGDVVVMVASSPVGRAHANLLKVHRIGSPL